MIVSKTDRVVDQPPPLGVRKANDEPPVAAVQTIGSSATPVFRDPFDASWRERISVLGITAGLLFLITVIGLIYARAATLELMGLVPASAFAVGKFLPLWGLSSKSHFSPWDLGILIWVMDTVTVLVLVYGLEVFYRIRALKRALSKIQGNAGLVLRAYPRIRRAAVIGVVLFVLFPVAGTGAIGGAFLGILLGLNRFVLIGAVSGGGLLGGMSMAFAAVYFGEAVQNLRTLQSNPAVKWGSGIALVAVLIAGIWWVNRAYKRALAAAQTSPPPQAPGGGKGDRDAAV